MTTSIPFRLMHAIASAVVLCVFQGANAATIHVPADHPTIQAAINASAHGDTVLVAAGTYNEAINLSGKALAIESSDGPGLTTINASGLNTSTVIIPNTGGAGQSRIQGFTITGGKGNLSGVGPTIRKGGGIHIIGGDTLVIDCIISGNSANNQGSESSATGGGLHISGGTLTMRGCKVLNNTSMGGSQGGSGGGVTLSANSTVIDCLFSGNQTNSRGGGVSISGSVTMINSVVHDNHVVPGSVVAIGGGIDAVTGISTIINTRITNNTTSNSSSFPVSAGVNVTLNANVTFRNCTIADNTILGSSAPSAAGGLYINPQTFVAPKVYNTIVFNNASAEIGSPATVQESCVEGGYAGEGNIAIDPLFIDATSGDYRLSGDSPCIDIGDLTSLPSDTSDLDDDGDTKEPLPIDLDGNRRVVNGYVDMGAYEWQRTCIADISPSKPGVAGNGIVDVDDLLAVINAWGECDICVGDIDGDNDIDVDDLLAVINGWGECK